MLQNSTPGNGIEGDLSLLFRILAFTTVPVMLAVSAVVGKRTKTISDKYNLIVTPPGPFFAIWGVIYISLIVAGLYNVINNIWSIQVVTLFGVGCLLNALWVYVFDLGTLRAMNFCLLIVLIMAILNQFLWIQLEQSIIITNTWNLVNRNIFSFYQGWLVGAANLNLGVVVVYQFGISKKVQTYIFWVLAPLSILGMILLNLSYEGGFKNNVAMYFSAVYALAGASISTLRRFCSIEIHDNNKKVQKQQ